MSDASTSIDERKEGNMAPESVIIPQDDPFDSLALKIQLKASFDETESLSAESSPRDGVLFGEDPFDTAWSRMKKD